MTWKKKQEREIYIAYKDIFSKNYALLRKNKTVEQRFKQTKHMSIVRDVREKHHQDVIIPTLRELLSARVFEDEKIANMYFSSEPPTPPTTAEPSPSTAPEPVTPQIDAPKPTVIVDKLNQTAAPVASTKDELQGIFVAYKHIFSNEYAVLRKQKAVEERVNETKHLPIIRDIYEKYGHDETVKKILLLLFVKAFESEERANIWLTSMEPSEDETMRDNTISLPTPPETCDSKGEDKDSTPKFTCSSDKFPVSVRKSPVSWTEFLTLYSRTNDRTSQTPPISYGTSSSSLSNISSDISSVVSSDTSSVTSSTTSYEDAIEPQEVDPPHRTQILILSRMQQILEAACFEYAEDMMPSVLREMKWTCPEAGELNIWACHLRKRTAILEHRAIAYGIKIHISTILNSCVNIRHFAVHRKELHGDQLVRLAEHAVALCTILITPEHEHEHVHTLQRIRDAIKTELSSLAMSKRQCATRLDKALGRVTECRTELLAMKQEVLNWAAKRRTELDAMEQESIRSSRVDFDYQKTVSWENVEVLLYKKETPPLVETHAAETQATDVSDADLHHIRPEIPQGGKDRFEGIVSCFPLFPTLEACHTLGQILRWVVTKVVTKAWSVTLIIAESLGGQQNTWISVFWLAVFFMVLLGLYCMGLVHIVQITHN